jgi:hypothetical protein
MAEVSHGPIEAREFQEFLDSLTKGFAVSDKDKLRKITVLAQSHTFTAQQVADTCELTKSMWCDTAVLLYPSISDQDNFDVVLKIFKYKDEREEVMKKVGLM